MRVFVELPQSIDAASWGEQHKAGRAADATPYGLHHLEAHGHVVRFRRPLARPAVRRAEEVIAARLWGMQAVHGAASVVDPVKRAADVVLCMDERNGLPAAFAPCPVPVVTGVAWLEDPDELGKAYTTVARRGLARAAGVFVECSAMLEPLERDFGVPRDKLHFVTLGIDAEHFTPSAAPPIPGRVFSVGDDRMRDYDTLVSALQQVRTSRPTTTWEVATTLPVDFPSWVTVHRRRMDHAVRECYHRASVVALALHPTRQGSGLTVILEAMASGRPVVATDNPGLDDYIVDGETGILVPPNDPRAMAAAIDSLLRDPDRAAAMGRAGRLRVEGAFTTRRMAACLNRVIAASLVP